MHDHETAWLIGVDTGGTYTDAVIISSTTHTVVASAKALTTRGNLAIGVGEAIARVLELVPSRDAARRVGLVSVSTTLATNAVVEGHGGSVAAILAGFDDTMLARSGLTAAFPQMPVIRIAGGHDHNGDERSPLDLAALGKALERHAGEVEAFAVAAHFAVRNPAHERAIRDLVIASTTRPVTMSSELSSALDAPRRALTAVLNARLISRISLLVDAVRQVMARFGIDCPLMVVKGDGTLALADGVALRPIETVLSGPAASLVGAATLSGLKTFIMSDMGGTTTDLGILIDGRPRVREDGAAVGGWRTMVTAVDVTTTGLGGDSEVSFAINGAVTLGPQRAVPISLVGDRFPEVLAMLDAALGDPAPGADACQFVMRPLGHDTAAAGPAGLSAREADLLALVGERPLPLRRIAASSGAQRALQSLRRRGIVQIAAFTPSDAAHVLNLQDNWSRAAALKAAALLTRGLTMAEPTAERIADLCTKVWSEVVRLAGHVILDAAMGVGSTNPAASGGLREAVCRGVHQVGLATVRITPTVPVVAVGGPVRVYYGEVGKRLDAEMVFPAFCEVANAVGAATGVVARTVRIEVSGDGAGLFRVHADGSIHNFTAAREALTFAEGAARRTALAAVAAMGADNPEVRVGVHKQMLPDAVDDNGLFEAIITAEAVGRPRLPT
jgi:N-methylhydantoinase A/oxoprolinase/acetone carboxylase beta subunit